MGGGGLLCGERKYETSKKTNKICVIVWGEINPLSPNVADLQHFDIVLFCGFSFCNAFRPGTELFTKSLLVVRLSQGLVKKAG